MIIATTLGLGAASATAGAGPREIQDNSFLMEEAYNQEDGVIQHIQAFQRARDGSWTYSFTEEWPIPNQTHQLSVTVIADHLSDQGSTGLGDMAVNYRYQAVAADGVALSPRLSLLLPTGKSDENLGAGTVGYQLNLPLSIRVAERVVTHWNLGATLHVNREAPRGDSLVVSYGVSTAVLLSNNLNMLLEFVGSTERTWMKQGGNETAGTLYASPGFRYAFDFDSGLQVVPGVAVPVGVGPSRGDVGALAYLSLEHPLF